MPARLARLALPLAALLVTLAAPAAASAKPYAPKLQVTLSPATQSAPAAITTVTTQAADEAANRTVVVRFPKEFSANAGAQVTPCTAAQFNQAAPSSAPTCPDASRIGAAKAETMVGPFAGSVYFGGIAPGAKIQLFVFISNGFAPLNQKLVGVAQVTPTGQVVTFDNLPSVTTTRFELALEGGTKGLIANPGTCGTFAFQAEFTSQEGTKATASQPVTITGCPPVAPSIDAIGFSPGRLRSGRTGALVFRLDAAARATVTVRARSKRLVYRKTLSVRRGRTVVRGIARRFAPGSYRATLVVKGATGGRASDSATFTVVKPKVKKRARVRNPHAR